MGKIIQIPLNKVILGEHNFDARSLVRILDFVQAGGVLLPPSVRNVDDYFVNLNGRHRLIYQCLSGAKTADLYFANSPEDHMTRERFPSIPIGILTENNQQIATRWQVVVGVSRSIGQVLPDYLETLKLVNPHLHNLTTCKKYVENLDIPPFRRPQFLIPAKL